MIKIESKKKCQSYWKNNGFYDKKRDNLFQVKIFGIIIYQKKEIYNCDLQNEQSSDVGFNMKINEK